MQLQLPATCIFIIVLLLLLFLCYRQSLLLAAAATAAFLQVSRTGDRRGHQDDGTHKASRVDVIALSTIDGRRSMSGVSFFCATWALKKPKI